MNFRALCIPPSHHPTHHPPTNMSLNSEMNVDQVYEIDIIYGKHAGKTCRMRNLQLACKLFTLMESITTHKLAVRTAEQCLEISATTIGRQRCLYTSMFTVGSNGDFRTDFVARNNLYKEIEKLEKSHECAVEALNKLKQKLSVLECEFRKAESQYLP